MTLPLDYTSCPGADWEECDDCQRRTAPGGEVQIAPPAVVTFECENYIPPDRPEDQRLRELARGQGGGGMTNDWQPMRTAPRIRTEEILATDYDSIEIIHWAPDGLSPAWEDRDGNWYYPSLWQPLPDVPSLPEEP